MKGPLQLRQEAWPRLPAMNVPVGPRATQHPLMTGCWHLMASLFAGAHAAARVGPRSQAWSLCPAHETPLSATGEEPAARPAPGAPIQRTWPTNSFLGAMPTRGPSARLGGSANCEQRAPRMPQAPAHKNNTVRSRYTKLKTTNYLDHHGLLATQQLGSIGGLHRQLRLSPGAVQDHGAALAAAIRAGNNLAAPNCAVVAEQGVHVVCGALKRDLAGEHLGLEAAGNNILVCHLLNCKALQPYLRSGLMRGATAPPLTTHCTHCSYAKEQIAHWPRERTPGPHHTCHTTCEAGCSCKWSRVSVSAALAQAAVASPALGIYSDTHAHVCLAGTAHLGLDQASRRG